MRGLRPGRLVVPFERADFMGVLRFQVHPPSRLTAKMLERVYLSGPEQSPWPSRTRATPEGFELERSERESGRLSVPWKVPGHGELTISTATLMEREKPYHLEVELARGKINQVREQEAIWRSIGLAVPENFTEKRQLAQQAFARAVTQQHDPETAASHTDTAIAEAVEAAAILTAAYSQQGLAARHRHTPRLNVLFGVNLGHQAVDPATGRALEGVGNTATVPVSWIVSESGEGMYDFSVYEQQIDWCRQQGLKVIGGPLLQLDRHGLPDWLYLWEGDFENVTAFVEKHVRETVVRFQGQVDYWLCASRFTSEPTLSFNDEEMTGLLLRALEVTRTLDPETPILVRFDQPWSEFMARNREDESPLWQRADQMLRWGLGLAAIDLEINMGYYPGGSYPRDLLDLSRLVDLWSVLGMPLFITLTCPSSVEPDPAARSTSEPIPDAVPRGWSPQSQAVVAERMINLLLAKPIVYGITWNQLRDAEAHEFPHSGLINARGIAKPLLEKLRQVRGENLV